jgi:ankyrin repeat protein
VRRILTWLCFAKQPIHLDLMNEMLAVRTDIGVKFNENRCYVNMWDILGVCPGLISLDTDESHLESGFAWENQEDDIPELPDQSKISCFAQTPTPPVLRIAHFSVFEYLVSDPSQEFSASEYHLQVATANAELAKCCIIFLSEKARLYEDRETANMHTPTTHYCARFWDQHMKDCGEPQDAVRLASDFLSSRSKYELWRQFLDHPEEQHITKRISRRLGLAPGYNPRTSASDPGSPAFYAARIGLTKTLKELIAMGCADVDEFVTGTLLRPQRDLTFLQAASSFGHLECVQAFIDEGADPAFLPPGSWSALRLACHNEHLAVAEFLIDNGSNIDKPETSDPDHGGTTLLHSMCEARSQNVVAMLLRRGARVNALDLNSDTPLHLTIIRGHGPIVNLLLRHNANTTIQNQRGHSPLFEALVTLALPVELWESLIYPEWWLERGTERVTALLTIAGNAAFDDLGCDMKTLGWIFNKGCEIDAQDVDGFTALHLALFNGHFHLSKELLDHGCRVDMRSRAEWLPLHSLASCGRELEMNRYEEFDFVSMINTLSLDGTLIDIPGELGLCPAHLTVLTEIPNLLESFVRAGANFILQDMRSATALDCLIKRIPGQGFSVQTYSWILGQQAVSEFQQIFGTVENFVLEDGSTQGESDDSKSSPKFLLYPFQTGFEEVDLSHLNSYISLNESFRVLDLVRLRTHIELVNLSACLTGVSDENY